MIVPPGRLVERKTETCRRQGERNTLGHRLSTIILTVGLLAAGVGYAAYTAPAEGQAGPKDALVINPTGGKVDLHAVTMALELAGHALDDNREVIVFLNMRGAELASKNLPATCSLPGKPPIPEMMGKLMARGAVFLCCPSCMQVLGVQETDLAPGVKLASKEGLFGSLGEGAVVFSY
jgi:predicted peroxiredoxin